MSEVEHKETIYIQDQITAKPGKAKEVLAAYMDRYAPAAKEERGMTLVSRLITPPMWLNDQDDQGNTLYITWTVQGRAGLVEHELPRPAQPQGGRVLAEHRTADRETPS